METKYQLKFVVNNPLKPHYYWKCRVSNLHHIMFVTDEAKAGIAKMAANLFFIKHFV